MDCGRRDRSIFRRLLATGDKLFDAAAMVN